jgi:predicted transcriptional regulator
MRNVRQFISGMKNYLVGINVESEQLRKEIRAQTETLSNSEFLNIDAILEDVLVELVICPLHLHIRALIESYNANGEPLQLNNNASDSTTSNNGQVTFAKLKSIYEGFEESLSPMTKLDRWNEFVCQVFLSHLYCCCSFNSCTLYL